MSRILSHFPGRTDTEEDLAVSSNRVRLRRSRSQFCPSENRKAASFRLNSDSKNNKRFGTDFDLSKSGEVTPLRLARGNVRTRVLAENTLSPYDKLVLLRQGRQSVVRYTRQFCTLVAQIPPPEQNDQRLKDSYIDGLAYPVQVWLSFFKPKTCSDAIAIAVSYETNYWSFLGSHPHRNQHDHHAVGTGPSVTPVVFDCE